MFFAFASGAPQDGGPVARLLADCGLPFEDIGSHISHCILARDGAELAGCVGLEIHEQDALLRSLAVAPAHRGKGLAQRLYDSIVADARARGIKSAVSADADRRGVFPATRLCRCATSIGTPGDRSHQGVFIALPGYRGIHGQGPR